MKADILNSITPFGSCDVGRANDLIDQASKEGNYHDLEDDTVTYFNEMVDDCEIPYAKVDLVACVYEAILRKARTEVEEKIEKDLINDYDLYVAGNYICTSFDTDKFDEIK